MPAGYRTFASRARCASRPRRSWSLWPLSASRVERSGQAAKLAGRHPIPVSIADPDQLGLRTDKRRFLRFVLLSGRCLGVDSERRAKRTSETAPAGWGYSCAVDTRSLSRRALALGASFVLMTLDALLGGPGVVGAQPSGRVVLYVELKDDSNACGELVDWQVGKHLTLKLDDSQTRVFMWADLIMPELKVVADCKTKKPAQPLPSSTPAAAASSPAPPIPALVFGDPSTVGLYRQQAPAVAPRAEGPRLCTTPCQIDLDRRASYHLSAAGLRSSGPFSLPEDAAGALVHVRGYGLDRPRTGKILLGIGVPLLCGGIALISSLQLIGGNDAGVSYIVGPVTIGGGFALTLSGIISLAVRPRLDAQVFGLSPLGSRDSP